MHGNKMGMISIDYRVQSICCMIMQKVNRLIVIVSALIRFDSTVQAINIIYILCRCVSHHGLIKVKMVSSKSDIYGTRHVMTPINNTIISKKNTPVLDLMTVS